LYLFEFIQSKYNLRLIYITFLQAFLSSLISCVLALPFAISLFRRKKKLINRILISLSGYSFVLPSILIVYSVIGIFGTNGVLNKTTNLYNLPLWKNDSSPLFLNFPLAIAIIGRSCKPNSFKTSFAEEY